MTIWSLIATLITDPGYIPDSFFTAEDGDFEKVVSTLNEQLFVQNNFISKEKMDELQK